MKEQVYFIRVTEEQYKMLTEHAKADRRSRQAELEIILDMYFDDAKGFASTDDVKTKRKKEEATTVRKHIVDEGRALGLLPKPSSILTTSIPTVYSNNPMKVCKNGHIIPSGRDRCTAKGCKYS